MQRNSVQLRAIMKARGLTQEKLSKLTGVSQPTISRVLRKRPQRQGRARETLFTFVENEWDLSATSRVGRDRVLHAFDRIWDGSEVHATAVAKVIDALDGLRPFEKQKE